MRSVRCTMRHAELTARLLVVGLKEDRLGFVRVESLTLNDPTLADELSGAMPAGAGRAPALDVREVRSAAPRGCLGTSVDVA